MPKQPGVINRKIEFIQRLLLLTLVAVIVATPVALSRQVLSQYTLPKFITLAAGSSLLLGLLCLYAYYDRKIESLRSLPSLLIGAYLLALAVSTMFSIMPGISFLGSIARRMGFITYFCFAVCFWAVIAGAGNSSKRFNRLIWAIVFAGFIVSVYGLAQILGLAPIARQQVIPGSESQEIFRIDAGLGHPNYAGNFLLYVVFTALGAAYLTEDKRLRLFAATTSLLAVVAIAFTGTRGAWLGLLAGGSLLFIFGFIERAVLLKSASSRAVLATGIIMLFGLTLAIMFIALAESASPIRARLMAFSTEGFTGAGRTILWKLSLSMVPQHWLTGTGLEMFRVACMPYKTTELALVSGGVNPEDAHNAYFSSLLSTGIIPTLIYISMITVAVRYLLLSIRRAQEKKYKLIGIGLLSSISAVLIHNLFIFFLIPTGLYFFIFLALSFSLYKVVSEGETLPAKGRGQRLKGGKKTGEVNKEKMLWALCAVPFLATATYCYQLFIADQSALYSQVAAESCNYGQTVFYGRRATSGWIDQTDYHCHFAMALEKLAKKCPSIDKNSVLSQASAEAEQSLRNTLMTDVRLLYLSELYMTQGNLDRSEQVIQEAELIDSHTPYTHLVKAKLFLIKGDARNAYEELMEARNLGGPYALVESLDKDIKSITGEPSDSSAGKKARRKKRDGG